MADNRRRVKTDLVTTLQLSSATFPGEFVELPDGTSFPKQLSVFARLGEGPILEITLNVEDGRPVVTKVAVERPPGAPPLSASSLHDLPMAAIFEEVVARWATFTLLTMRGMEAAESTSRPRPLTSEEAASAQHGAVSSMRGRPVGDEMLRRVVQIVRSNAYNPRKQVGTELNLTDRTASRWIAEARRRGFFDKEEADRNDESSP